MENPCKDFTVREKPRLFPDGEQDVPIDKLYYVTKPRRGYVAYKALAVFIREQGLLSPIFIKPDGEIIEGRSRFRACQSLGHATIRAIVYTSAPPLEVRTFGTRRPESGF